MQIHQKDVNYVILVVFIAVVQALMHAHLVLLQNY